MEKQLIPSQMLAAVWRGGSELSVEEVPVPETGRGEILVRVEACGLCPTDIKKIDLGLVKPPVILGHEFCGRVVNVGEGAEHLLDKRVSVYHHVPCKRCRLCELKLYSQCLGYKKTGTTAGFEPSGGGWAEYVKVFPWIVKDGGVVEIPESLPGKRSILMEPLNTCLKCVNALPRIVNGQVVILGQGPVGLMLSVLAKHKGWDVFAVEPLEERKQFSLNLGVKEVLSPGGDLEKKLKRLGDGLGPDAVIAATESEAAINTALCAMRFGGTMILFAHTRDKQSLTVDGGAIGKAEKRLIGSYSSSVDLNKEVLDILIDKKFSWEDFITHIFPLEKINKALDLARHPKGNSLKIAVMP